MPPQNPAVPPTMPSPPIVSQPQQVYPQQQPQMPPQPMQLNPAYGHDKLATASLILGIVSLPASILNVLTLPIPITAIVLGIISLKRKKSFAIAGIVLGVIGIILSAIVLIVGTKILNDKKNNSSVGSSVSQGVSESKLSSTCYTFSLPNPFTEADVTKNSDCATTIITADGTDDIAVNSTDLTTQVSSADTDNYLKNLSGNAENSITTKGGKITTRKFITLDGVRAYQATGTESYGNYKYLGYIVVLAPKDYISVTGIKLRAFIIAYDSLTSQDRIDELAQSWHWQ